MEYHQVLEQAMRMEEKESFSPIALTREEMLSRIASITETLKGSMPHSERILLAAERHGLRTRLERVKAIANKLMGKTQSFEDKMARDV